MSDALQGSLATGPAAIRVLIADDHPIVRAGLAAVLAREKDIQVVGEAADGQRAVALTRERQPDVVLMDLRMPVLDGIAAIDVITRELPCTRVLGRNPPLSFVPLPKLDVVGSSPSPALLPREMSSY
jgi:CheY-like chemotaxis protein